jgi:hypothetical protein
MESRDLVWTSTSTPPRRSKITSGGEKSLEGTAYNFPPWETFTTPKEAAQHQEKVKRILQRAEEARRTAEGMTKQLQVRAKSDRSGLGYTGREGGRPPSDRGEPHILGLT